VSTLRFGLGCMGMSPGVYGPADEDESIATIHSALDAGVTLIDTGDFYGSGHNEMLIGRALKGGRRDKATLSVKFGALRAPNGSWIGFDGRPASVKNFLAHSLTRLGVSHIDIYRPSRPDPTVPIEDTIGAIAECVKAGWVRQIGLSEAGVDTIRRAKAVHPIVDLQIEYGLASRGPEAKIFPVLAELGIGVTAYGVLSRGLLSGRWKPGTKGDNRAHFPRFTDENRATNQIYIDQLEQIAEQKGISAAQLAIAWVLTRGERIIPVLGCRTRAQLTESLGALAVRLSAEELADIELTLPPSEIAGARYPEAMMKSLDSERS
jgi:aryl-alcohol dehydrogenase-like predicted oxidoreductase